MSIKKPVILISTALILAALWTIHAQTTTQYTGNASAPDGPFTLWYRQPATQWADALPLANGRIGAMVYGGVRVECCYLSETTFWSGEPSLENNNPQGPEIFREVRQRLLDRDLAGANELAHELEGRKLNYGTNLPFGNLRLLFNHEEIGARGCRRVRQKGKRQHDGQVLEVDVLLCRRRDRHGHRAHRHHRAGANEEARAPVAALEKLMRTNSGFSRDQLALVEMSETSAAQALAVRDAFGLEEDELSPDGGALVRGYPLGAASAVSVVRDVLTSAGSSRCRSVGAPASSARANAGSNCAVASTRSARQP